MSECGLTLIKSQFCDLQQRSTSKQHSDISPLFPWCAPQQPFCRITKHSCNASAPLPQTAPATLQPVPSPISPYIIPYMAQSPCRAANNTASRGVCLFLSFCNPAAEHNIWHCICLMTNSPTRPASLTFSLWIPPSSSITLSCPCAVNGEGEGCAGLHVWQ